MRLVILCEGDTEKAVLKDFLAPYLSESNHIEIRNTKGSGNLANDFKLLAELELEDDPEAVVFCLIDLLNVPFPFPKDVLETSDPYPEQFRYLRRFMQDEIEESVRDRFFAFPVVMEPETWLLADEQALNDYFRPSNPIIRPHTPESIEKPTEKLSDWVRQFRPRDYSYKKMVHGPAMFRLTSAQRVYDDNCPHFKLLIDEINRVQGLNTNPPLQNPIPKETLYHQWAELEAQRQNLWREFDQIGNPTEEDLDQAIATEENLKEQIKNITDQL